ncbi:MAG TPA: ATP-binding protein [Jatrophihabitantaceae bacterium]
MTDLLHRLTDAVNRRVEAGWAHASAAEAALAALSADDAHETASATRKQLDTVVRQFGLDEADAALFEVAALAEQSVAAHLLLGLLSGNEGPARPSVAVALELAGLPPTGGVARARLGELAPLRRYGLAGVLGSDVLLARQLAITERLAGFLGDGGLPPVYVLPMLVDTVPIAVDGTDVVVAALQSQSRLVWIHTRPGGAATSLATAACDRLGVACLVADLNRLDPAVPVAEAVTALQLECALDGLVLVLIGAERASAATLTAGAVPVLAISHEPWNPQWSSELPLIVSAPRLSVADRQEVWAPVLGGAAGREITAMPLSPEQIVAVSRHADRMARLHGEDTVSIDRIRHSVRQLGRGRVVRANPDASATLDDLVLSGHALDEIRRLLDWARYRDEVIALGPLHGKGGKGTGICALFAGPPGTGKTLAAHVIADSLGMDLYQVELSSIVDKYIGETEKNLEKVFAEAEAINAVLFFDEADALFGSRSEVKDAKDRYANQEIAYLLQRMEQFDGITVLASNLRGNIDPAFARRLHFIVSFPEPDAPTRRRLWHRHLGGLPTDRKDPVDVDWLASHVELAGGDVRNIVLSAAYAAVAEGKPLGMRHIDAAVRREYIKLGRRPPERVAKKV